METKSIILLQASDGCKLYNEKDGICVFSVLITDGDTSGWREVTEEEAEAIEAEQQAQRQDPTE